MNRHRQVAIIEAPSVLGLKPTGVQGLSTRLLEYGLGRRLNARYAGNVEPPDYDPRRDPETRTLNARQIAAWTPRLADAVEAVLAQDEFPVILGGDCSILLGSALALKRRGRFGLLFIDGHADFYQPEVNPTGEAASMELAFVTGHGPAMLCDLEGRAPLIRADDVVALGFRDRHEQEAYGSQPLPRDVLALDLDTVRRMGCSDAAAAAVERCTRAELDGFFIHFDVDSLNDAIMPAVDYRIPDGLGWGEIRRVLEPALASPSCAGIEVTIYNPALDEAGTAGRRLTDMLVETLQPPGTGRSSDSLSSC